MGGKTSTFEYETSTSLSEPEKSILGKGLNFVPLTKKTDEFTVKEDTEKFLRRVKLKAHFHDKEQPSDEPQRDEFESLKPKKSNWTPPDGQFTSVDLFVKKCRVDIQKLNFNKSLKFSNLSKEEWTAHQNLKTRDDIVIKPADKGGAVVVWRTDLYKQEAFRQLADTKFYAKVNKDLTQANQKIVKDTVNKLILEQKLPSTARNLFVTTPKTSTFYLKPKIHKPNNPGRPIISACSCPTELISSFLDKKMAPFVKSLPTYIKDTNHALNILKQFSFPGNNKFLFTMDITSLYTVIPNNEGLLALKYFFDQRTVKEPSTDTLLRLAELVLTLNCFTFSGEIFKQINGVAMGTKMGPNYANLFVGYVEEQIFNQFDGPKPELFGRYIDDCLGATSCTKEELERFIGFVNSFHPALKFTWEISETSVTFLDINISVQDNKLATSVHYKPTDSHSYLLYSSSHPSQFVSLRFVGRLFFVMKMSFKFDTAKKFFRVLFDSEFICLFSKWHEIQAFSENRFLGFRKTRTRLVLESTRLPTHLTSKTQFRTPNFSDSVGSAAKIQTLTPNATKCPISFPNVAIRTASCLKHSIGSKTSIENRL